MISLKSGVKLTLMKKLSLYIFLVLMWCNVGFAEEIKSKLGFYLELPLTWIVIDNQNVKEFTEKSVYGMDDELMREMFKLADNHTLLYIIPTNLNPKLNNININVQPLTGEEVLLESDMPVFCEYILDLLRDVHKKLSIKQYECKLSKLIPKFHNVIEMKHGGLFKGQNMIQFIFDDKPNAKTLTLTTGCEYDNCKVLKRESIRIINSIRF